MGVTWIPTNINNASINPGQTITVDLSPLIQENLKINNVLYTITGVHPYKVAKGSKVTINDGNPTVMYSNNPQCVDITLFNVTKGCSLLSGTNKIIGTYTSTSLPKSVDITFDNYKGNVCSGTTIAECDTSDDAFTGMTLTVIVSPNSLDHLKTIFYEHEKVFIGVGVGVGLLIFLFIFAIIVSVIRGRR